MSAEPRDGRVKGDRTHPERPQGTDRQAAMAAGLAELLRPVIAGSGHDLESLNVTPAGKRRVVRVVVDADGGVNLDDVATVSRDVSEALDGADELLGGLPYVLEVTSPGVDRPLTEPRHWRRAAGRLVAVTTTAGLELEGRIISADTDKVVLDVTGQQTGFAFSELGPGRVQVEFKRVEATDLEDVGEEPDGH
ncbi:MAG: ribosome maturation factor RimP [Streptosporangiaceae bacterium]